MIVSQWLNPLLALDRFYWQMNLNQWIQTLWNLGVLARVLRKRGLLGHYLQLLINFTQEKTNFLIKRKVANAMHPPLDLHWVNILYIVPGIVMFSYLVVLQTHLGSDCPQVLIQGSYWLFVNFYTTVFWLECILLSVSPSTPFAITQKRFNGFQDVLIFGK